MTPELCLWLLLWEGERAKKREGGAAGWHLFPLNSSPYLYFFCCSLWKILDSQSHYLCLKFSLCFIQTSFCLPPLIPPFISSPCVTLFTLLSASSFSFLWLYSFFHTLAHLSCSQGSTSQLTVCLQPHLWVSQSAACVFVPMEGETDTGSERGNGNSRENGWTP